MLERPLFYLFIYFLILAHHAIIQFPLRARAFNNQSAPRSLIPETLLRTRSVDKVEMLFS